MIAFLVWSLLGNVSVVGPVYPPTAFNGGTVVAALELAEGTVQEVRILFGEDPFVAATKEALSKWRFDNSQEEEPAVLVVVNFRGPNLYPTGSPQQNLSPTQPKHFLPTPTVVIEPAYPVDSLGEGSVVLDLEIADSGNVTRVKEIKGAGALTSASIAAVKQWQFKPARNSDGGVVSSKAYAVCVFRRPLLAALFWQ